MLSQGWCLDVPMGVDGSVAVAASRMKRVLEIVVLIDRLLTALHLEELPQREKSRRGARLIDVLTDDHDEEGEEDE